MRFLHDLGGREISVPKIAARITSTAFPKQIVAPIPTNGRIGLR
jgi:hypothetical protein